MKDVKEYIINIAMPFAIRYVKEKYRFQNGFKRNISYSLPNLTDEFISLKKNVVDINTLFDFEEAYFKLNTEACPFGKRSSQCKSFKDKVMFIAFYMISDISNFEIAKNIINVLKEEKKL